MKSTFLNKRQSKHKRVAFLTLVMMLSIVMVFSASVTPVFADTTGIKSASDVTGWTNPQNSKASDNVYTSALMYSGQDPGALASKGFGFSIPSDATITGIEVSVERYQTRIGSIGSFTDSMACLIINGTPNFNANRAVIWTSWSTVEGTKTFGGPTDLWGLSLTPADVNNAGFGFYLRPIKATGKAVAYVDYIGMTIYYTLGQSSIAPVIAAHDDMIVEATSGAGAVVEFNATATDNIDPTVAVNCTPASGSQFALGTTQVICNATDSDGNSATPMTFNVMVQDTTAPVITLTGNDPLNINQDLLYVEEGSTWVDAVDGSGAATVGGDVVDTSIPGVYHVTYNYTDVAGNAASQVTRTVNVLDTAPPVIAPQSDMTIEATSASGAIVNFSPAAADNVDSAITVECTPASGSQFALGTTQVTCNATDSAGNAATPVTFNVTVQDTTAPVLTLTGINPYSIHYASTYVEPGATWTDAVDGSGSAIVGGQTVDTLIPGTYNINYNYTDAAGNAAVEVTRDVIVEMWATIIINKDVRNWKGNAAIDGHLFTVQLDGSNDRTISQTLSTTYDHLAPGTYTITELTDSKYILNTIIGDNDADPANGASITVGSGQTVDLLFTNWKFQINKK